MYKQICTLVLFSVFYFTSSGQNKDLKKITEQSTNNAGKPKIIDPESRTPFPYRHSVNCGIQDKSGNLWFGSSDGIYRYDGKIFTNYRVMDGLPVDHVSVMLEDKSGNIWFGAKGGIVRYDPVVSLRTGSPSFSSIKIRAANSSGFIADSRSNPNAPEAKNPVSQMMEDKNGDIWFYVGFNLYRSDGRSGAAITTCVSDFLKNEKEQYHCANPDDFGISCIYEDKEGNILISTGACSCGPNISYLLNASRTDHPCVLNKCKHDLHKEQDLAAHYKELSASFTPIAREDGNTGISFSTVLKDKAGNVWVASDSGVYRYEGKRFLYFSRNDMLRKSIVSTIYEDKSGNIWFGTAESAHFHGNGVFRYDPSPSHKDNAPSITQFTTKDGLCSNHPFSNDIISTIIQDNMGKIWFGGDAGICYYDPSVSPGTSSELFTNFSEKDGMKDDHVSFILKDRSGYLWFGSWNLGLYRYDGKSITCFTE